MKATCYSELVFEISLPDTGGNDSLDLNLGISPTPFGLSQKGSDGCHQFHPGPTYVHGGKITWVIFQV